MEEQDLYDELEYIKSDLENGEIDAESASKKLGDVLASLEELIEKKLDDITEDYDQLNLYEDD